MLVVMDLPLLTSRWETGFSGMNDKFNRKEATRKARAEAKGRVLGLDSAIVVEVGYSREIEDTS